MRQEDTTQTVSCDRCHKSVRSIERPKFYPDEWKTLDTMDLCPDCAVAFGEFMGWDLSEADACSVLHG
jgi:hypothetical protein